MVSKEQIMALQNLHGYWKYSDVVVPFRIEPLELPQVAKAFVPRSSPPEVPRVTVQQPTLPVEKTKGSPEITTEVGDEFDLEF